jgi:ATP-binding cassette subfamily F protein 3
MNFIITNLVKINNINADFNNERRNIMHEISFDGVKKYLDATLVLRNISFQINKGEKVGIIGENGSGKTTILKLIAGILKLNHCAGYPYAPIPPGY